MRHFLVYIKLWTLNLKKQTDSKMGYQHKWKIMIFAQFCTNCTGSFRRTDLEKGSNRFLDYFAEIFQSKILIFHSLLLKGKKIQFHYDFSRFFKKEFPVFSVFFKRILGQIPIFPFVFLKKKTNIPFQHKKLRWNVY